MSGISALILTRDESANLARCIASLGWCDEVVVLDSGSTDGTQALAKRLGARVFERPFDDFGRQREAARVLVDWRSEWILSIDADEEVDQALATEVPLAVAAAPDATAAFRVRRKDHFKGRWIRRASLYPSWHIRLFRHRRVRYPERAVHEYPDIDGGTGSLSGHLLHHNFSQGLGHWWQRHLRYAQWEAAEAFAQEGKPAVDLGGVFSADPVCRRRALKALSYRLPCRPTLRYLYMMWLRGAVLDGPAGWTYCRMIADYQHLTDQFLDELRRRARGEPL